MNRPIARFVTRRDDVTGKVDLLIGAAFQIQDHLKPNRVYELRDVLGEVVLVDVGCMHAHSEKEIQTHDISTLVEEHGKYLYLSEDEYAQVAE